MCTVTVVLSPSWVSILAVPNLLFTVLPGDLRAVLRIKLHKICSTLRASLPFTKHYLSVAYCCHQYPKMKISSDNGPDSKSFNSSLFVPHDSDLKISLMHSLLWGGCADFSSEVHVSLPQALTAMCLFCLLCWALSFLRGPILT